jgi:hypothetical protein
MADAITAGSLLSGATEGAAVSEALTALGEGLLALLAPEIVIPVLAGVAIGAVIAFAMSKVDSPTEECTEKEDETAPQKEEAKKDSPKFNEEQRKIVTEAKTAKKTGLSEPEAKDLVERAKSAGLKARGPETHVDRPCGKNPHIHVGPVNHIPVK